YAQSNRRYMERDLRQLEGLGRRAALALDNALLFRDARVAREQIEAANRSKDEVLGIISHELRSPITTIYGSAPPLNLRRSQLGQAEQTQLTESIEEESAKMTALIDNLLLLSRVDVGVEIEKQDIEVAGAVENVVATARQSSPKREVKVTVRSGK